MVIIISRVIAIGFAASSASVGSSFESIYTDTGGVTCMDVLNEESLRVWRCKGPAGYSALFSDEGNVVEVEYGLTGQEKSLSGLQWQATNDPIGPKIEWRLTSGEPFATILRVNTQNEHRDLLELLLIARVTASGSCQIAAIDARSIGANSRARHIADTQGPTYTCRE